MKIFRIKTRKNRDGQLIKDLSASIKNVKKKKLLSQDDETIWKTLDKKAKIILKKEKLPRYEKEKIVLGDLILRGKIEKPKRKKRKKPLIFVFGSNLAGRHGKGSAKRARIKYGAKYGIGKGRTGRAYAIPTKDKNFKPLPLSRIQYYVSKFFHYAYNHPEYRYKVVKIGCGLAGYSEKQIKPMFKYFHYLKYVKLPEGWKG
jgi:hypothetical protein